MKVIIFIMIIFILILDVCFHKNLFVYLKLKKLKLIKSKRFLINLWVNLEGRSLFSDLKLRNCMTTSQSMHSISYCTGPHVFVLFARMEKKFKWFELIFQSLANDDVKESKTRRISAKIDTFRTRLIAWIVMQLISRSKT